MDEVLAGLLRQAKAQPNDPELHRRLARALARSGREHEALDALRQAARSAPLPVQDDALRRRLHRSLSAPLADDALRARIGEALGLGGPYADPPGLDLFEVHGGAVDASNRAAWLEESRRSQPGGGALVDAQLWVKVAAEGSLLLEWEVATYNPYFGCKLWQLTWWEERVVVIYHEKHDCLLAVLPLEGAPQLVEVDDAFATLDDLIVFRSREPGLLLSLSLPDLEPRLPLPVPGSVGYGGLALDDDVLVLGGEPGPRAPLFGAKPHRLRGDLARAVSAGHEDPGRVRLPAPAQRDFPRDPAAFQRALLEALFGDDPPQPLGDLLVGSLTFPFWLDLHQRGDSYARGARPWNSPRWLAAYWHRHLGESPEADALVATLDSLASRAAPAVGWSPRESFAEGSLRLAKEHALRRCAALAKTCREGRLPTGTWCSFWAQWCREGFRRDLGSFPSGFREVYESLARGNPESLPTAPSR